MGTRRRPRSWIIVAAVIIGGTAAWMAPRAQDVATTPAPEAGIELAGDAAQIEEFMAYHASIRLTREQETVKRAALFGIAAPCCGQYSAYTCCCECNLARSIWGLSNHLIAERGLAAQQVGETVEQWIDNVNPSGFSGSACFDGGCARAFAHDGCGGMDADHLVLD